MAIPTVTPLPTAPSRSRPTTFSAEGDVFLGALENTFTPQLNAVVAAMNVDTAIVNADKISAQNSATAALASSNIAVESANAVAWASGTTYPLNAVVISQIDFQAYRKTGTTTTTTDPADSTSGWLALGVSSITTSSLITQSTTFAKKDNGKFFRFQGEFSVGFAAPSVLGNGWFCYFENAGSGRILLSPPSPSLVDGVVTTLNMYAKEVRLVRCDGVNFVTIVLKPFEHVFTTSSTFQYVTGYTAFCMRATGGGGGGGAVIANSNSYNVNGGGGGGFSYCEVPAYNLPATSSVSVLVGIAGAGANRVPNANEGSTQGGTGGTSSVGNWVQATGGFGGGITVQNGTTSTQGSIFVALSELGGLGASATRAAGGAGGGGTYTPSGSIYNRTNPGPSAQAGSGGASNTSLTLNNPVPGNVPGGGGGSSVMSVAGSATSGVDGAAGARGEVRIWGVI